MKGLTQAWQSMRVLAANEWNELPNSCLFGVIKIVQIEAFLREFSFSSIISLNILDMGFL